MKAGDKTERRLLVRSRRKAKLRTVFRKKRDAIDKNKQEAAGIKIMERVLSMPETARAETVFVYAANKSEVPTKALIQELLKLGKQVAVPKVKGSEMDFYLIGAWEELLPGYQGILEPETGEKEEQERCPVLPKETDMMLLPGLVFDKWGGRIGYGGGFYDRYIEGLVDKPPCLMGLCFQKQMYYKALPLEPQDKRTDYVVTEQKIIKTRK